MNMRGLPAIQYYVTGGQINDIYESLFDRGADPEGLAYYENLLKGASVADAIAIIGGGARGEDVQEVTPQEIATKSIVAAYEDALGRPGQDIDVGGLQFYQDQVLNQGLDATLIDNILASSPEAQTRFGEDVVKKQEEAAAFSNLPGQVFAINPDTGLPFVGGVNPNPPTAPVTPGQPVPTVNQIPTIPYAGTTTAGSLPGLAAIPAPQTFLPAAATAMGRADPYFLRTAAAPIAVNPVTGQPQLQGPTSLISTAPAEGMAEGGDVEAAGSRALTPAEIGSRFNISEFVDDEGRLISGYSRPIRDQFGTILGYEDRPYARDVVFNPILARRQEEARRMADMANMAKGGLADVAQDLASKGRYGDTMVAHISPQEAGLLKAMGGSGTINPETGLPEFFSLFPKKGIKLNLGPLGNIKVGRKSSDLLLAAAAGYAGASGFMGLNPTTAALTYGGVRAAATGNLQEGIMAGLSAYGMGEGFQSMGVQPASAAGATSSTAGTGTLAPGAGGVAPEASGQVLSQQVPIQGTEAEFLAARPEFGQATTEALSGMPTSGTALGQAATAPTPTQIAAREAVAYNPLSNPEVGGMENLGVPFEVQAVSPDNATALAKPGFLGRNVPVEYQKYIADPILNASGTTLAAGTVLGGSLLAGQQERAAYAAQAAAARRAEDEKKKRYSDLASRLQQQYPFEYAKGGIASLAGGGMTYMEAGGTTGPTGEPRDVTGTGDGMSDSVPASIEGVQEARLADGEFVIPADVVADIGNGSSDAGSKKLYDMMDRIRMARHGTKEQPPEIKAERLMPA